jgi:7-cyano-7-deazaguanine tRNA-ribosyltransferase
MVSFAELITRPGIYTASRREGLARYLDFTGEVFLDNGAFSFQRRAVDPPVDEYVDYVERAKPDWCPVPTDYIPIPSASRKIAKRLAMLTSRVNSKYGGERFVPVIHMGKCFWDSFLDTIHRLRPRTIAIGGMVPHIRYMRGARPRAAIQALAELRRRFAGPIHVFGLGGGITSLHLAAALGIDSVDSSGWRVCAARGLIMLPGSGQRRLSKDGRGRVLSGEERRAIASCRCSGCRHSMGGYKLTTSFQRRAAHNLSVLVTETQLINRHVAMGDIESWSGSRLKHNALRHLVEFAFQTRDRVRQARFSVGRMAWKAQT